MVERCPLHPGDLPSFLFYRLHSVMSHASTSLGITFALQLLGCVASVLLVLRTGLCPEGLKCGADSMT